MPLYIRSYYFRQHFSHIKRVTTWKWPNNQDRPNAIAGDIISRGETQSHSSGTLAVKWSVNDAQKRKPTSKTLPTLKFTVKLINFEMIIRHSISGNRTQNESNYASIIWITFSINFISRIKRRHVRSSFLPPNSEW